MGRIQLVSNTPASGCIDAQTESETKVKKKTNPVE